MILCVTLNAALDVTYVVDEVRWHAGNRVIVAGNDWPERLAEAVALSAAAVLHPVAGDVDRNAYRRFRDMVRVEEV